MESDSSYFFFYYYFFPLYYYYYFYLSASSSKHLSNPTKNSKRAQIHNIYDCEIITPSRRAVGSNQAKRRIITPPSLHGICVLTSSTSK